MSSGAHYIQNVTFAGTRFELWILKTIYLETIGNTPIIRLNKITTEFSLYCFGKSGLFQPRQFDQRPDGIENG